MDSSKVGLVKELPVGLDEAAEEEYASQSKLLQDFNSISSIDKAWIFKSDSGRMAEVLYLSFYFSSFYLKTKSMTDSSVFMKLLLQE